MTLKKINPEDLVEGQKYLVEMEYRNDRRNGDFPLVFFDVMGARNILPAFQPIYTLEQDQPIIATLEQSSTSTELEMLVNVASRIYTDTLRSEPIDECVKKAQRIITACKNTLKEVSHD